MRASCFKILFFCLLAAFVVTPSQALAKPEYAERTKQNCEICHIEPGGPLTQTGLDFAVSGYRWPPKEKLRVLFPLPKTIKVVIGFLHILTAFIWFGTILYVHIILRPAYASKGLPKTEKRLGIGSMIVMAITGVMLLLSKIPNFDMLHETIWGKLLLIKILLFFIMVITAIIVLRSIGPKLTTGIIKASLPKKGVFDSATLASFDGKEGRRAFIAYELKVYDVSQSKRWSDGVHLKRHSAGTDLTSELSNSPHGIEKLKNFKIVGIYDHTLPPSKTTAQKLFYFMAYLNLSLVFAILLVIAYWKWGI